MIQCRLTFTQDFCFTFTQDVVTLTLDVGALAYHIFFSLFLAWWLNSHWRTPTFFRLIVSSKKWVSYSVIYFLQFLTFYCSSESKPMPACQMQECISEKTIALPDFAFAASWNFHRQTICSLNVYLLERRLLIEQFRLLLNGGWDITNESTGTIHNRGKLKCLHSYLVTRKLASLITLILDGSHSHQTCSCRGS